MERYGEDFDEWNNSFKDLLDTFHNLYSCFVTDRIFCVSEREIEKIKEEERTYKSISGYF